MMLLTLLLILQAVTAINDVNGVVFKQRPMCESKKYFEMTFTVYQKKPPFSALEIFSFKTEVRPLGDKSQLAVDIDAMLSSFRKVGNPTEFAAEVERSYDAFLADNLTREGMEDNCPTVPVADLGFQRHKAAKQSLTISLDDDDGNVATLASDILTVVSGYWNVPTNKYTTNERSDPYEQWMRNALQIRMPYVIFTDKAHVELIQQCRAELPTLLVLRNQSEFVTHKSYDASWVHPEHVPSAALANIWLEKINLLLLACQLTNTTYYAWLDAALCTYRDNPVPPEEWSLDVILSLPVKRVSYAYVSASYHSYAGGVALLHRDLIPVLHELFYKQYNHCMQTIADWHCGSDQYLLTQIRDRLPHLFHPMSYQYGDINLLWANKYPIPIKKVL